MKTNRYLILLLLLLCALLCACGAGGAVTTAPETTAPPETTEATQAATEATQPPTTEATEATEPPMIMEPIGKLYQRECPEWFRPMGSAVSYQYQIEYFQSLCFLGSWYNRAMQSLFSDPAEIDLSVFLRYSKATSAEYTDQEHALLEKVMHKDYVNYDHYRLTFDQVEDIMEAYFGLELESREQNGLDQLTYLPETDAYYWCATDYQGEYYLVHSVYIQEDGTHHVYYSRQSEDLDSLTPQYVLLLKPYQDTEERYQILANLDAQTFLANRTPADSEEVLTELEPIKGFYQRTSPAWFRPEGMQLDSVIPVLQGLIPFGSWYNRAMLTQYTNPKEMDLHHFFAASPIFRTEYTDREIKLLTELWGSDSFWMVHYRMETDDIDDVLEDYFGLELADTEQNGMEKFDYLSETDAYYDTRTDANGAHLRIHSIYLQEDGVYQVYYCEHWPDEKNELTPDRVAFLKPYATFEQRYYILANLDAEEFLTGQTVPDFMKP